MERIELKAAFTVDEAGSISGVAWPFNAADRSGDVIQPKAFASALGKTLPMLAGHTDPVGVWTSIATDAEGLKVAGRLLVDDVPEAKSTRALVKAGAVTGLSIGFLTRKASPRKGGGRTISDLDLLEVSIVAVPAHAGAHITSAKELPVDHDEQGAAPEIAALGARLADFENAMKGFKAPDVTPLEKRLTALENLAARPKAGETGDLEAKEQAAAEKKAFGTYLRHGDKGGDELKALTVSSDPQGGYLAPAELSNEFIRNLVLVSPIRSIASIRTTTAPSVKYPARTSITNAQWEGETDDQPESSVGFGQKEIPIRTVTTYVDISNQLLSDSAGQAEAEVNLALSQDFGQKEGLAFVSGDGVLAPEGFMTNADVA
jgi:HK97 family phage prohead protease